MSYSIIAAILLATIALSSSASYSKTEPNALVRFYSDFAQLYRSATLKSYIDQEQTTELYEFCFSEKEYTRIAEESLAMLYTNVVERTVTFHSFPNFEVVGSRYFYRRDPKEDQTVEIELVNSEDRLFRDVREPNRYFYLSSFDNLEYFNEMPVMPYYEVSFICNASVARDIQKRSPLFSYIDKSVQYSARYLLDLPSIGSNQRSEMYAYADIRNNGDYPIVIKGAELIAGDVDLDPASSPYLRTGAAYAISTYKTETMFSRPLGEQASGTYVYQLSLSSPLTLPARSLKSVEFLETNVTIDSFVYYSSVFSPLNSNGKLLNAYNLTSMNNFLPNGRLLLREQGRFLGQVNLPDLPMGETYTMTFGSDADVSYRRQVKILEGNENSDTITYYVEYLFENYKLSRDVRVYFTESFSTFKYFQVKNISTSKDDQLTPDLISYGTDLRGLFQLPRENGQKMLSFNLILYKFKPTTDIRQQ